MDDICARVAQGQSLAGVLRGKGMPDYSTVMRWLDADEALREKYTRARAASADAHADEVIDIGYRTMLGEIDPQAARVAVDCLKWSAGKQQPKKYGDRLIADVAHSGSLTVVTGVPRD